VQQRCSTSFLTYVVLHQPSNPAASTAAWQEGFKFGRLMPWGAPPVHR
jgi:hypothetical protein